MYCANNHFGGYPRVCLGVLHLRTKVHGTLRVSHRILGETVKTKGEFS